MLLADVHPLVIVVPIVIAQYIYATFALVRLARMQLPTLRYVLWNIFIMVVFFIGPTALLVYSARKKS